MKADCNRLATPDAANDNQRLWGDGVFILDDEGLAKGRFGVDTIELAKWLDSMTLNTRIITGSTGLDIEHWRLSGFEHVQRRPDTSATQSGCALVVTGFKRVFIATSQSELPEWCNSVREDQILVACVRTPSTKLDDAVRKRMSAVNFMQRFMFPVPPAIKHVA